MEHVGHQLSGYVVALAVAPLIPHPAADPGLTTLAFVCFVGIGALLPDLDMPSATAAKLLGPVTWILAWLINKLSLIVWESTRAPRDRMGRYPGHRTLTHTALWGVVVGVGTFAGVSASPLSAWAFWAAMAMVLGHFAHLWGDAITLSGIPLWAPFIKRNEMRWFSVWVCPKGARFRVGGHREKGRIKTESRWAWINLGEGAVTGGLAIVVGLLGTATLLAAGGPWWNTVDLLAK